VLLLVALWTLPTAGLLISSCATRTSSPSPAGGRRCRARRRTIRRAPAPDDAGRARRQFVIEGNLRRGGGTVSAFGFTANAPTAFAAGEPAELNTGDVR
jgi:alpha-glucoside transport system permease protein